MKIPVALILFCGTAVAHAGQTTVFFHNDASGTPAMATDVNGNTVWKETYRPYGDRLVNAAASSNNTVWFTGKQHDNQTGLTYMGARYYDPALGRFTGMDPAPVSLDNPHTLNRYAYASNNPYRYVDPDGRDAVEIEFVGYMVETGTKLGKQPLGHGGVLLINEQTGLTRYYEYGRYAPNQSEGAGKKLIGVKLGAKDGNIRKVDVPNAVIGKDGKPTKASLQKIYDHLSKEAGQGKPVDATYHDDVDFEAGDDYAQETANDEERDKYNVLFNNCFDFAEDVVGAGDGTPFWGRDDKPFWGR